MMSFVFPRIGVVRETHIAADDIGDVPGGATPHIPVLGGKIADWLAVRDGGIYLDGTFGAGGYTKEILAAADCKVIAVDRDQSAVARGMDIVETAGGRLTLVEDRFSRLDEIAKECGAEYLDGIVLDIGVSSMQLDRAERGFSFRNNGPLDMRMGGEGPSAAELIAVVSLRELTRIISLLGEEKFARPIAKAIVAAREIAPITTTRALSDIVSGVVHARFGEIHPATRTFQALRIFINEELLELAEALAAAERALKPGGRLVVVTFHSLEDRIVKTFINERSRSQAGSRHMPEMKVTPPSLESVTRKPVVPDDAEVSFNPRSRSAKLRAASRTQAAPHAFDAAALLPDLPSLSEAMRGG